MDHHQPLLQLLLRLLLPLTQGTASRCRRGQDRCRATATREEAHSQPCKARLLPPVGARAPSRHPAAAHPQWRSSVPAGRCSFLSAVVRDRRHCHRDAELLMPPCSTQSSPTPTSGGSNCAFAMVDIHGTRWRRECALVNPLMW